MINVNYEFNIAHSNIFNTVIASSWNYYTSGESVNLPQNMPIATKSLSKNYEIFANCLVASSW